MNAIIQNWLRIMFEIDFDWSKRCADCDYSCFMSQMLMNVH